MKASEREISAGKYWNAPVLPEKASYPRRTISFFWGLLACWAIGTLCVETQLGWPADRAEWGHRAIGWFVNVILVRTFFRGMKRIKTVNET